MGDNAYVGQANYALNLLRNIRTNNEPVLLSPFAITAALGIAYLGAAGTTRQEMLDVFAKGWFNCFYNISRRVLQFTVVA